jgi:DNA-binding transcriptional regulator YiaG
MNIKQIRKSLGLNQKEFGKLFFKSQQSVSDWENGTAKPSKRIEQAIKKLLEVKL